MSAGIQGHAIIVIVAVGVGIWRVMECLSEQPKPSWHDDNPLEEGWKFTLAARTPAAPYPVCTSQMFIWQTPGSWQTRPHRIVTVLRFWHAVGLRRTCMLLP